MIDPLLRQSLEAVLGKARTEHLLGEDESDLLTTLQTAGIRAFRKGCDERHAAVLRVAFDLADKGRLGIDPIELPPEFEAADEKPVSGLRL